MKAWAAVASATIALGLVTVASFSGYVAERVTGARFHDHPADIDFWSGPSNLRATLKQAEDAPPRMAWRLIGYGTVTITVNYRDLCRQY